MCVWKFCFAIISSSFYFLLRLSHVNGDDMIMIVSLQWTLHCKMRSVLRERVLTGTKCVIIIDRQLISQLHSTKTDIGIFSTLNDHVHALSAFEDSLEQFIARELFVCSSSWAVVCLISTRSLGWREENMMNNWWAWDTRKSRTINSVCLTYAFYMLPLLTADVDAFFFVQINSHHLRWRLNVPDSLFPLLCWLFA